MAATVVINSQTFVSVKRAAEILNCSDQSIRKYLESGELAGFRRTKRGWWMVLRLSLDKKLNEFTSDFPEERVTVNTDGRRYSHAQRHGCF